MARLAASPSPVRTWRAISGRVPPSGIAAIKLYAQVSTSARNLTPGSIYEFVNAEVEGGGPGASSVGTEQKIEPGKIRLHHSGGGGTPSGF